MITYNEYKTRVNKLTSAIAMWIYNTNPSDEIQVKVMTKAQKIIRKWHDSIIRSTTNWS